ISPRLYNFIIGLTLCWGFAVNAWMVNNISVHAIYDIGPVFFLLGYFGSCFLGIYIFSNSDTPLVSFIGYNFVVLPVGLVVNIVVAQYDPYVVSEAIQVTGIVTAIMMVLGTVYPKFFDNIIVSIGIAWIFVFVVELIQILFFGGSMAWVDWACGLIFCGYIGYDWARACRIPKTVDNAIDSAAALYIDIIALFIRILRILGRR
uniref:Bax inhibitor-1 family protein n=1 Tax=Thaumasiovibrio occultus TaxID=1891184 RepID=UPI00192CE8EC